MTDLIKTTTIAELLTVFNTMRADGTDPVKRFSSRTVAESRVSKRLEEINSVLVRKDDALTFEPAADAFTIIEPVAEPVAEPTEKPDRKKRGMRFVFPARKEGVKPHREGTKRATVVSLLLEGASFEDVQKATGWSEKDAYEGIRLVHYHLGYGMNQDAQGRIYITWVDSDGSLKQNHA